MPNTENTKVPEAQVVAKKRARFSFVWVVPLVAALAGAWIAINTIRNEGPKITIIFKSADGLEANKTSIRYNGVEIGEITAIQLADDYQSVIATAKMSPRTEEFLRKDTRFWVVKPQISGANISGLSTLISGAYIGMEIGKDKESERHYTALAEAPPEAGGVTGKFFTLKTPELGSLGRGTPIYFRRLQAGQVESYELDPSGDFLNVRIFVQSPYDRFVTTDTRFWQASGVDLSLTASGLQLRTESLLSILVGGIAFESPEGDQPAPPAGTNTTFELAKNHADAFRPPANDPQTYKLVFKESLRGLTVGAPVELNGITIGEVTAINAQFDRKTHEFSAPVTIQVDPARYGVDFLGDGSGLAGEAAHREAMDSFVARGLRAQLKSGSIISGARFVALEFFPDAPKVALDWSQKPLQLPTQPGAMESIEAGVTSFIGKLGKVQIDQIGQDLRQTLAGMQSTLTNTDRLVGNAGKMIAPGSPLDAQINGTLQQVGGAAEALRVLADYLERHPEAVIYGKPGK